jgi:hypothetical protein
MAYTQEQINAALVAELNARPGTKAYDLADYAMKTYGITPDQINAAYKALDVTAVPETIDYEPYYGTSPLTVKPANYVGFTGPSHTVVNPATGKVTQLTFNAPGFDPNDPYTLERLGELVWDGSDNNGRRWYDNYATPAQKAAADSLWEADWKRRNALDIARGTPGAIPGGVMPKNRQEEIRINSALVDKWERENKVYTPFEQAAYTAFKNNDVAGLNRAIQEGQLTRAQVQLSFGLSDADAEWLMDKNGVKFFEPTADTTGLIGDTSGVTNTVATPTNLTQTTPTGLLEVGKQATSQAQTQAAKTYSPAEVAAYNAYRAGDIAGVNRAIQTGQLTRAQVQSSFGLNDADMNWLVNNSGVKFYTPTTVTGVTTGGTTVGNKTYTQAETDLYNAYRAGNIAEVNRLLAANKWTGADIKSKFGLTDADIAWITNNAGGKFYNPAATTGITNVINTIGGTTTPAGQFPDLFPSFAESQRLATQAIASRPTTQQLVNMISNPQNPALTSAWQTAEKTGQYGDVAGMLQNMPLGKVQSAYGLSNADMQYIMSRPEIATALSQSGMVATPAPTLNNVLGLISK